MKSTTSLEVIGISLFLRMTGRYSSTQRKSVDVFRPPTARARAHHAVFEDDRQTAGRVVGKCGREDLTSDVFKGDIFTSR